MSLGRPTLEGKERGRGLGFVHRLDWGLRCGNHGFNRGLSGAEAGGDPGLGSYWGGASGGRSFWRGGASSGRGGSSLRELGGLCDAPGSFATPR